MNKYCDDLVEIVGMLRIILKSQFFDRFKNNLLQNFQKWAVYPKCFLAFDFRRVGMEKLLLKP